MRRCVGVLLVAMAFGNPVAGVAQAQSVPLAATIRDWRRRANQDLRQCDTYVREVRRRRAEMIRLARAGSPEYEEVRERNDEWLEEQENGPFGEALEDLRAIMDEMQELENDEGTVTLPLRAQLARQTALRCRP